MERNIPKSAWLLCKGTAAKYGFSAWHRRVWLTRTMCRAMAVCYEWLARGASQRRQDDG